MQMRLPGIFLLLLMMLLTACSSKGLVTAEERQRQQEADYAVANILFENGLEGNASYNVHKDGAVVIRFDESVSFIDYNRVVGTMRTDGAIGTVRAEQSGREVCPLK